MVFKCPESPHPGNTRSSLSALSVGSHCSGISHPPGYKNKSRSSIFAAVPSDVLINAVDGWNDGHEQGYLQDQTNPLPDMIPLFLPYNPTSKDSQNETQSVSEFPHTAKRKVHDEMRSHPYYSRPRRGDGKYYCPFAEGIDPCTHLPTMEKWAYVKHLDSHLKPFQCKVTECDGPCFSSDERLHHHEREVHGEAPYLCSVQECERSLPGNGFPRRWNLHDHIIRLHDPEKNAAPAQWSSKNYVGRARKRQRTRNKGDITPTLQNPLAVDGSKPGFKS
ncbi:hypothetical protein GX50_03635 [[Emmonsia] crescens]|uniref:C2H2-type domain-containing protein n=1 Tax=[Emmonsia] crescens TaxID=73230 RepID=A0A2B7ZK59_9EURO|nr:hypothetical protein GX50_03635 [Emmonsia crescens]